MVKNAELGGYLARGHSGEYLYHCVGRLPQFGLRIIRPRPSGFPPAV